MTLSVSRASRKHTLASLILAAMALRATTVGSMGLVEHLSPLPGTVVRVVTPLGTTVRTGDPIVILESMKMEHVVAAKATGTITSVSVTAGDAVGRGDHLVQMDEGSLPPAPTADDSPHHGHGEVRPELAELLRRRELVADDGRPDAVARRHATGHRTARENINDLCDRDSFIEYGPLVIAAQRARRD